MPIQQDLVRAIGSHRGVAAADRLCQACVQLIDVDEVAISIVLKGTNAATLGVSSASARVYDEVQFTLGQGPCVDAVRLRSPILVPDLSTELRRWPMYAQAMLAHEIGSVFALPVVVAGEYVGVLGLFRRDPGPLAGDRLLGALAAADMAGVPVLDLVAEKVDPLQAGGSDSPTDWTALARVEVHQATGMVAAQLHVSPVEALARLRAHAFATDASASDVARAILDRQLRFEID